MKRTKVIMFLIIVLIVFIYGCTAQNGQNNTDLDKNIGFESITKLQCEKSGGKWNECGSPCAGTGAEICIQVCRVQCECGGIAGYKCPKGYKCLLSGKIKDEIGICVN